MLDTQMSAAWREAAKQFSIHAIAPYSIGLPDGSAIEVEAFIPNFGGPQGAIAVALSDGQRCRLVRNTRRWYSQLGSGYGIFDSALFEDTLEDWGWFGSDEQLPRWYTGKYYGGRKTLLP